MGAITVQRSKKITSEKNYFGHNIDILNYFTLKLRVNLRNHSKVGL
jgi:hypothetical protein